MAKNPQVFVMPDIPNSEVPDVLQELKDEGLFDVVEQKKNNGTTSIKVKRKAAKPAG